MTKNKEDIGKPFITLDMDETRELRWDFRGIKTFEDRARNILRRQEVIQPGASIYAGGVLANFIQMADILEAAIAAATGLSGLEGPKGDPSPATKAIQGYLDRGGNLDQLRKEVYHSYLVVNDPSSVLDWMKNLERIETGKQIDREAADTRIDQARAEMEIAKKRAADLKNSGKTSPASPMSS